MKRPLHSMPWGIHIGDTCLYGLQLESDAGPLRARAMVQAPYAQPLSAAPSITEAFQTLEDPLRAIAGNSRWWGKKAVIGLPGHLVFSFPLQFSLARSETPEEGLVRNLAPHLPIPAASALLDYPSLHAVGRDNEGHKYRAMVCGTQRQAVEACLALCRRAGIDVQAVDWDVSALIRLHARLFGLGERSAVLCHVGRFESLMAVVNADAIWIQRRVSWGVETLAQRLLKKMNDSGGPDTARHMLCIHGLSHARTSGAGPDSGDVPGQGAGDVPRAVYQMAGAYVEELVYDFQQILSHVRADAGAVVPDRIFLYGRAGTIRDLAPFVAGHVGLETDLVDLGRHLLPAPNVIAADHDPAPFALAAGLSLRRMPWL